MSTIFRDLIQNVGSGRHTSKHLSREEACLATQMMLEQTATPAQIGAFMIAHRIKRPVPEEIAGMLDAYEALGPVLPAINHPTPVAILGSPYDGRSRSAPVSPIVALLLAAADIPVLMHGGTVMPTKYGLPFIHIWQALGLPFQDLSLSQVHQLLQRANLGFIYLPRHFPAAHGLVTYREQIGKRPPLASVELMWSPYGGHHHTVIGFVHPPTEGFVAGAAGLRGQAAFTSVKGLEGSCDLPCSRTAIIGLGQPGGDVERLLLHPRDYGFDGDDAPLTSLEHYLTELGATLDGQLNHLLGRSVLWNGGFYLWRLGAAETFPAGLALAERLLTGGQVRAQLQRVRAVIQDLTTARAEDSQTVAR